MSEEAPTAPESAGPDMFQGWMTMTEAAAKLGCTRQNVHAAAKHGRLKVRQFSNGLTLVHEDELTRWAASRPRKSAPFKLTPRQAEVLLDLYLGRSNYEYSHFVPTARALCKRGLVAAGTGNQLTTEGKRVAGELQRLLREELASDPSASHDAS